MKDGLLVIPLSPNSDQQLFSPNNIHTLSRDKVMRINKMIIIEKIPWPFIKFSQLILKGDVWRSVWRICMWILGLKGLYQVTLLCGLYCECQPRKHAKFLCSLRCYSLVFFFNGLKKEVIFLSHGNSLTGNLSLHSIYLWKRALCQTVKGKNWSLSLVTWHLKHYAKKFMLETGCKESWFLWLAIRASCC